MELKYIWVKNYNNIKDLGFNFSHSGNDKFEFQNNILQVIPKEKPVLNFGEKISSITAIAGKNGSGKSSLCEVIINSIATLSNYGTFGFEYRFEGIVCIGKDVFLHEKIEILNTDDLTVKGYTLNKFKESPFEEMKREWFETFQKLGFIYYSNTIDWRSSIHLTNLKNISTQQVLDEHIASSPNYTNGIWDRFKERKSNLMSDLEIYWHEENFKIISFYLNEPELFPVKHPDRFKISLNYELNNRFLNLRDESRHVDPQFVQIIEEHQTEILKLICENPKSYGREDKANLVHSNLKDCILKLYKLNVVKSLAYSLKNYPEDKILHSFIWEGKDLTKYVVNVNELISLFNRILENANLMDDIEFSPDYLNKEHPHSDWRVEVFCFLYLINTNTTRALLKELIELEHKTLIFHENESMRINNYSFFPFLSTGELSLYTLFSRLYNLVVNYKSNEFDPTEELFVFLDEGEVSFHPAWKKKYLKWLIDFFNKDFNKFKVQLILTTHSPYLLSDLNSDNLLLLKTNDKGEAVLKATENKRTFGANIHELLTEAFFLDDGLIGEFAQDKIQKLIYDLKPENKDKNYSKEYAQNLIKIIAEPLIQESLQKMFDEVYFDEEEIKKRIEELQNKLQRRNNEKNKD